MELESWQDRFDYEFFESTIKWNFEFFQAQRWWNDIKEFTEFSLKLDVFAVNPEHGRSDKADAEKRTDNELCMQFSNYWVETENGVD